MSHSKSFAALCAVSLFLVPSISNSAPISKKVLGNFCIQQSNLKSSLEEIPSKASVEATVELTKRLEVLAKQNKVVFLVEGTPLRKFSEMNSGNDANPEPIGTSPLLDKVTAQVREFDYKPIVMGNVVVLQKRYSDPRDTPSVTLQECTAVLHDLKQLSRTLIPEVSRNSQFAERFIDSLNTAQLKSLNGGKLAVRDLGADQRRPLDTWVYAMTYGSLVNLSDRMEMVFAPSSKPLLVVGNGAFSDYPSRPQIDITVPTGQTMNVRLDDYCISTAVGKSELPDGTFDTANTLGTLVVRVNESQKNKSGFRKIQLDTCLANKSTLMVGGLSQVSGAALAQGVAKMYGLTTQIGPNKEIVLTRRTVRTLPANMTPDQLGFALQRLIPDPVWRAMNFDTFARRRSALQAREDNLLRRSPVDFKKKWIQIKDEVTSLETIPNVAKTWALLRLHRGAGRQSEKSTGKQTEKAASPVRIPVSELSATNQNHLAAVVLLELGLQFQNVGGHGPVPYWIKQYPDMMLAGRVYDDGKYQRADLNFVQVLPNGETQAPAGTSGALYHFEAANTAHR